MIKDAKIRQGIPLLLVCAFTAFAFFRIEAVTDAMQGALSVCAVALIPSIFPFLLFTELLLRVPNGKRLLLALGKPFSYCFRTKRAGGSAYLIGILFGFPLGIKALAEYRREGRISKEEAQRVLLYSNNTGPAFLVGGIGARLLGSAKIGLFLYALQVLISFLFGCAIGFFHKKEKEASLSYESDAKHFSFSEIMRNAVLQMLSICGYVAFFSVVGKLLSPLFRRAPLRGILYSLLEIGTASSFLTASISPPSISIPLLSFAVCFSGLSVYLQSLDFLAETDICTAYYLPIKLLHGFSAFFLSYLLLSLIA